MVQYTFDCDCLVLHWCNMSLLNQQHMIADTVRMIRHCQSDQPGESSPFWVNSVERLTSRGSPGSFLLWKTVHFEWSIDARLYSLWGIWRHLMLSLCTAPVPLSSLLQYLSNHFQTFLLLSLYGHNTVCVCTKCVWLCVFSCTENSFVWLIVRVLCRSLRQRGNRGRQCGGEGERSLPAHYRQSTDAFRAVTQARATCLKTDAHKPS